MHWTRRYEFVFEPPSTTSCPCAGKGEFGEQIQKTHLQLTKIPVTSRCTAASARQREPHPCKCQDLSSVLPEQYEPTSTLSRHLYFTPLPLHCASRNFEALIPNSAGIYRLVPHKPPRPLHSQLPSTSPRHSPQLPSAPVEVPPPKTSTAVAPKAVDK